MFEYQFMQNALISLLIITPLLAIIGTVIVNNKMAFFSDAIGHSALTGVAIGVLLGIGASNVSIILFSALLAVVITILKLNQNSSTETIISIISSIAVAVGIVILSSEGGFTSYTKYIIGDILSITKIEILTLAVTFVVTLITMYLIYNKLTIISLNTALAKSRGINVVLYEMIFSILVAVIVALSIKWVGILVINSLIVIPCAAARNISKNMASYIMYSVLFSVFSGVIGLVISYNYNFSTGATIVLVNGVIYVLTRLITKKI